MISLFSCSVGYGWAICSGDNIHALRYSTVETGKDEAFRLVYNFLGLVFVAALPAATVVDVVLMMMVVWFILNLLIVIAMMISILWEVEGRSHQLCHMDLMMWCRMVNEVKCQAKLNKSS